MYTHVIRSCVGLLVALMLVISFVPAMPAQAITDTQVREQRLVVMGSLVTTLREQVKLMQMALIQRLERQVAELEARLAVR